MLLIFALYGSWESLNGPDRMDLGSPSDPRLEFSILRMFMLLLVELLSTSTDKLKVEPLSFKLHPHTANPKAQLALISQAAPPLYDYNTNANLETRKIQRNMSDTPRLTEYAAQW